MSKTRVIISFDIDDDESLSALASLQVFGIDEGEKPEVYTVESLDMRVGNGSLHFKGSFLNEEMEWDVEEVVNRATVMNYVNASFQKDPSVLSQVLNICKVKN